jgi:hypothetical protein
VNNIDKTLKEICGRFYKPSIAIHDDAIGELEHKLAIAIQERVAAEKTVRLRAEATRLLLERWRKEANIDEVRMKLTAIEAMGYEWRWTRSIDENGEQVGAWVMRREERGE